MHQTLSGVLGCRAITGPRPHEANTLWFLVFGFFNVTEGGTQHLTMLTTGATHFFLFLLLKNCSKIHH